jgi:NAD(P)-dependent dehydrogenase (short-subunit alcohol dehydrogenase family)
MVPRQARLIAALLFLLYVSEAHAEAKIASSFSPPPSAAPIFELAGDASSMAATIEASRSVKVPRYRAAKGAVVNFTCALAMDLGRKVFA